MKMVEACKILCIANYNGDELGQFAERTEEDYRVNLMVDGLPAATKIYMELPADDEEEPRFAYEKGFALGFMGSEEVLLHSIQRSRARSLARCWTVSMHGSVDCISQNCFWVVEHFCSSAHSCFVCCCFVLDREHGAWYCVHQQSPATGDLLPRGQELQRLPRRRLRSRTVQVIVATLIGCFDSALFAANLSLVALKIVAFAHSVALAGCACLRLLALLQCEAPSGWRDQQAERGADQAENLHRLQPCHCWFARSLARLSVSCFS